MPAAVPPDRGSPPSAGPERSRDRSDSSGQFADEVTGADDTSKAIAQNVLSPLHQIIRGDFLAGRSIHDRKRLRGIEHEVHFVAEVSGDASGGLDALLHLNAGDGETADAELVEALLEVRAGERIPRVLDEERFVTVALHEVHEPKLGIAFAESGIGIGVRHEESRQACGAEVIEQNRDVFLEIAIASSLPPVRVDFEGVL